MDFLDKKIFKDLSTEDEYFGEIVRSYNQGIESLLTVGLLLQLSHDRLGDKGYAALTQRLESEGVPKQVQRQLRNVASSQNLLRFCRDEYKNERKPHLPADIKVLNEIAKLANEDEKKFKEGIQQGKIHSQTSMKSLNEWIPKPVVVKTVSTIPVPKRPSGVLVGQIAIEKRQITNQEQAEEIQSALEEAIRGVVAKYPEILKYESVSIPSLI